jgi:ABC-type polysaccharide/polyol phosphate export permease
MSPGLYSLTWMEELAVIERYPIIQTLAGFNPFAVLFESYRAVIYGTETGGAFAPDVVALGLLLAGSVLFIALAMIFFKRLEPNFAKVM